LSCYSIIDQAKDASKSFETKIKDLLAVVDISYQVETLRKTDRKKREYLQARKHANLRKTYLKYFSMEKCIGVCRKEDIL
jgi:hypothetical protein